MIMPNCLQNKQLQLRAPSCACYAAGTAMFFFHPYISNIDETFSSYLNQLPVGVQPIICSTIVQAVGMTVRPLVHRCRNTSLVFPNVLPVQNQNRLLLSVSNAPSKLQLPLRRSRA